MSISYTPEETEANRLEALELHKTEFEDFDASKHAPGDFSYHEALHTASIAMDTVDRHLLEHPVILLDPEAFRLTQDAHTALFNLYQYLGGKHL